MAGLGLAVGADGLGAAGVVAGAAGGVTVREIAGGLAGAWATFSPFFGEPLKYSRPPIRPIATSRPNRM